MGPLSENLSPTGREMAESVESDVLPSQPPAYAGSSSDDASAGFDLRRVRSFATGSVFVGRKPTV